MRKPTLGRTYPSRPPSPAAARGASRVTVSADKFKVKPGVDTNIETLIENALKNAAECAALDVTKQMAADKKAMDELASYVRTAIMMECFPGGVIWQQCRR